MIKVVKFAGAWGLEPTAMASQLSRSFAGSGKNDMLFLFIKIYSILVVIFLFLILETFLFAYELMLGWFVVTGKDFEGDLEAYGSTEWKERVEKWKTR